MEIYRDAYTVGTDVPTYFATVANPTAKNPSGSVVGGDCTTLEEAKDAARLNIDKRLQRQTPKRN